MLSFTPRQLTGACAATLMTLCAACGDDGGRADAGGDSGVVADGGGVDSGGDDGGGIDSGGDSGGTDAGTDAGGSDSGGPMPEYDSMGCLTFMSASGICGFMSDGSACSTIAGCSLSDEGQCKIDCEMATTLCIDMTQVDACLAALAGGGCDGLGPCEGWLYFP